MTQLTSHVLSCLLITSFNSLSLLNQQSDFSALLAPPLFSSIRGSHTPCTKHKQLIHTSCQLIYSHFNCDARVSLFTCRLACQRASKQMMCVRMCERVSACECGCVWPSQGCGCGCSTRGLCIVKSFGMWQKALRFVCFMLRTVNSTHSHKLGQRVRSPANPSDDRRAWRAWRALFQLVQPFMGNASRASRDSST